MNTPNAPTPVSSHHFTVADALEVVRPLHLGSGNAAFSCAAARLFPAPCPGTAARRQLEINHGRSIHAMETRKLEISTPRITEKRQSEDRPALRAQCLACPERAMDVAVRKMVSGDDGDGAKAVMLPMSRPRTEPLSAARASLLSSRPTWPQLSEPLS